MVRFFRWLFCSHKDAVFVRNIHGDEINELNARSLWWCKHCQSNVYKQHLHED